MRGAAEKIEDEDVAARRELLRLWIEDHYSAPKQKNFVADTGLNQGLVSGWISGSKSFREEAAMSVEAATQKTSFPMPRDYLKRPKRDGAGTAAGEAEMDIQKYVNNLGGDVLYLRVVLNAVMTVVVRSTPNGASELRKALKKVPGHDKKYLKEVEAVLKKAAGEEESQPRADRRRRASSGGKKTLKQ
jgi:hypothetical protein